MNNVLDKTPKYKRANYDLKSPFYAYLSKKFTIQEMDHLRDIIFDGSQNTFVRFVNRRLRNGYAATGKTITEMIKMKKLENDPAAIRSFLEETGLNYFLSDFQTDLLCAARYEDSPGNALGGATRDSHG